MTVLIVEDVDEKFQDVALVVAGHFGDGVSIRRAATVIEAEELSVAQAWGLLVLDISMDIVASRSGRLQSGHASTGGLAILERMYLLGKETPTIVVTAFDAFRTNPTHREDDGILGLEDVSRKSGELIGAKFLGAVRYGVSGWERQLLTLLMKVTL